MDKLMGKEELVLVLEISTASGLKAVSPAVLS